MQRDKNAGVSLVEFAVALIVVAVSVIYAAPLYYKIANNHRATTYTNELVATLTFARVQAVTQSQPVSVCASDNGMRCTDTPWAQGYIAFVDNGTPGLVDPSDRILKRHLTGKPQATITLNGNPYVRFDMNGAVIARAPANAAAVTNVARSGTESWLDRLSPLATAEASDAPFVGHASPGMFTVCAGHTGRAVRVSAQGFITTSAMLCR